MRRRAGKLALASMSAFLLVLAACGGGGQATGEGSGPIRVGMSLSLTGTLADQGTWVQEGVDLWMAQDGEILDRKVEMVIRDDKSNPATAARIYENLISGENVDLLLGPYGSGNGASVATVADRYSRFIILTGASAKRIFERSEYSVQMFTPQYRMPRRALELAQKQGYQTIAVAGVDNPYGQEINEGIKFYAQQFGLEVVLSQLYPEDTKDLSSLVLKMRQQDPDVVYTGGYIPDSVLFIRQASSLGLNPQMYIMGPVAPVTTPFIESVGNRSEYIFGTPQWVPSAPWEGVSEFNSAFEDEYGRTPNYTNALGYGTLQVLEQLVESAGTTNDDELLQTALDADLETMFGPFNVNEEGVQSSESTIITQILDGEITAVYPAEAAREQPVFPFPTWGER